MRWCVCVFVRISKIIWCDMFESMRIAFCLTMLFLRSVFLFTRSKYWLVRICPCLCAFDVAFRVFMEKVAIYLQTFLAEILSCDKRQFEDVLIISFVFALFSLALCTVTMYDNVVSRHSAIQVCFFPFDWRFHLPWRSTYSPNLLTASLPCCFSFLGSFVMRISCFDFSSRVMRTLIIANVRKLLIRMQTK